jgi:restriction endonuclease S subunit
MVPLGSLGSFKNGLNYTKDDKGNSIKIVGVGDFKNYLSPQIEQLENVVIGEQLREEILLQENDLIFVRSNGNKELVGRCMIIPQINEPITYTGFSIRLRFTNINCLPIFYCYLFRTDFFRSVLTGKDGANISNINQEILKEIQVPIISIDEQEAIVSQIEKEQILANANIELIAIYEQKIKDEINKLWAE